MKNIKKRDFLTVTRFTDSAKGSNWEKVTLYLAKCWGGNGGPDTRLEYTHPLRIWYHHHYGKLGSSIWHSKSVYC